MSGSVSLNINGSGTGIIPDPNIADKMLLENFGQTNSPRFGDTRRFAHMDGNLSLSKEFQNLKYKVINKGNQEGGTSHYATFLLKNAQGVNYFFSKNGSTGGASWEINTESQLQGRGVYGGMTPIGTGSTFYRKK